MPARSFSQIRRAHGLVFVSGEVAHRPCGQAPQGAGPQTQLILEHLAHTLGRCGLTLGDVVQVQAHLGQAEDFQAFDQVYRTHFAPPRPTRTTVLAASLYPGACVELTVVAAERAGPPEAG